MDITIFIAKILGVYFLVSGIFIVTHRKTLGLILRDLFRNQALTFVVGALLILGGALIVFRTDLSGDWIGWFVWLTGWAMLIKGALYILSPRSLHRMVKPWTRGTLSLMGATVTAIGVYLVFFIG